VNSYKVFFVLKIFENSFKIQICIFIQNLPLFDNSENVKFVIYFIFNKEYKLISGIDNQFCYLEVTKSELYFNTFYRILSSF